MMNLKELKMDICLEKKIFSAFSSEETKN